MSSTTAFKTVPAPPIPLTSAAKKGNIVSFCCTEVPFAGKKSNALNS